MNKKTIWITGGSTGIGKAVAIKFSSKGWNVAISARRENLLREISDNNRINYLSKIDILDFKFESDFVVDGNLTYSDTDHWSKFGEVYFGKKLVFNSILKDILFP